ncbi:MAG: OadG family protein [Candidatus Zhuqueibacterota bacterium]
MIDFSKLELGFSLTILGMLVVFLSLLALFSSMKLFIRLFGASKKSSKKSGELMGIADSSGKVAITGEIAVAISLAIQLSRHEFHDLEQTIVTLNRITKPYSPWSSKIQGIRSPLR